jgi:predicted xylose isomerase-like sugar epimerase
MNKKSVAASPSAGRKHGEEPSAPALEIENIESMRRQQGIEDVELREEIRALGVGDFVKLTFLVATTPATAETLPVRITSIKGMSFRGKLASKPTAASLSMLHAGSTIVFTRAHIHSVARGPS